MIIYKNENIKNYKIGYLITDFNDKLSFRYQKLKRTDIARVDILNNFDYINNVFTIVTTSNLIFNPENKVELDGMNYKIETIYTEEFDEYDGNISNSKIKKTYLVLKS